MTLTERRTSVVVALVGAIAFGLLAWWLVPWDPVGRPVEPAAVDDVFTAAEVARAESFARWARLWGWGSLVVSLAVAGWLGFTAAGERLVAPVARAALAGRGAGRGRVPADRAPGHAAVRGGPAAAAARRRAVHAVVAGVGAGPRRVAGGGDRDDLARAAAAGGDGRAVASRLAGDRGRGPGRSRAAGVVRLPAAGRAAVQPVHAAAGRAAAHRHPGAGRAGGRGGRRRAGGRRVASYDDPQRLRVGVRVDPAGRRLRHLVEDDPGAADPVGRGPRAGARPARRRADRVAARRGGRAGRGGAARPAGGPGEDRGGSAPGARGCWRWWPSARCSRARCRATISRTIETRADVDALAATGDPDAFVALQRRLALRSLADPTPPAWSQLWFGTHPTALERIGLARAVGSAGGAGQASLRRTRRRCR